MLTVQKLAEEAIKKLYDGSMFECYNGYHLWWRSPNYYNGSVDPWTCTWSVDLLGALFLAHLRFNKIGPNDSSGNFWTNSLIEETLGRLDYFSSDHQRNRAMGLTVDIHGNYLDAYDQDFKKRCDYKLKYMLLSLIKFGKINTIDWSTNGICTP